MKIKDIDRIQREWLKSTDLDNFFTVSVDKLLRYVYNLNVGLYINVSKNILKKFALDHDMHWPLISYRIYGTTRLAWLLLKVNNISTKDIFKIREAGEEVLYLPKDNLSTIIEELNKD